MFVQFKYERDNDTQAYLQHKNERENANTVGIAAVWALVCAYTRTHCRVRVRVCSVSLRLFSPGVLQEKLRNIEKQWSIS